MDFLDYLAVRNDSVFLRFTPSDIVANSARGLEAWESYKGHKRGQNQRLSDLKLRQAGSKLVSRSVVRGKLRVEGNKFGEQRCVCVGGQAARARIGVLINKIRENQELKKTKDSMD